MAESSNSPEAEANDASIYERLLDDEYRVVRVVLFTSILVCIWIIGSILVFGRDVIIPIAIAVMLWALINAIGRLYGRLSLFGKHPSETVCRFAAIGTIFIFCWAVIEIVVGNVAQVRSAAPEYGENLRQLMAGVESQPWFDQVPTFRQLVNGLDLPNLLTQLSSTFGAVVGQAGLVALYVAFMLLEQNSFNRKMAALMPNKGERSQLQEALAELEYRIERYLWIKTLVSLLTASLCYPVMALVGVNYAMFWALLIFLLNFIPNIGSLFAVVFPSLLAVMQFTSFMMGFWVLVGLSAVQFIVGSLIEPRLMGNSLNLSPLVIILSLTVWGSIWGIAGMFMCVPLTVILMIVLSHFEPTRGVAILLSSHGRIGRD